MGPAPLEVLTPLPYTYVTLSTLFTSNHRGYCYQILAVKTTLWWRSTGHFLPIGGSNIITFWSGAIDKSLYLSYKKPTLKSSSTSCCKYFAIIYFARKTNALAVVGSSCIYTWRKLIKARAISLLTFLTFFFFPFFQSLKLFKYSQENVLKFLFNKVAGLQDC